MLAIFQREKFEVLVIRSFPESFKNRAFNISVENYMKKLPIKKLSEKNSKPSVHQEKFRQKLINSTPEKLLMTKEQTTEKNF